MNGPICEELDLNSFLQDDKVTLKHKTLIRKLAQKIFERFPDVPFNDIIDDSGEISRLARISTCMIHDRLDRLDQLEKDIAKFKVERQSTVFGVLEKIQEEKDQ